MGNLFRFIVRFHVDLVFILLCALAINLLAITSKYQQTVIMSRADAVKGLVYKTQDSWFSYLALRDENLRLAQENAALHNEIDLLLAADSSIYSRIEASQIEASYIYTPAKVVGNSVNQRDNYLILNVGSNQGIEPGMGVISSTGIVGTVERVALNSCTVMSLLTTRARDISAMLKKSGHSGQLVWDARDINFINLKGIQQHVPISEGDTIVTSNISQYFPEGIVVGTIVSNEVIKGQIYDIKIRLSNDFQSLQYVTLLKRINKDETDQLKELVEKAK